MSHRQLNRDNSYQINKEVIFAVVGKLSIQQRSVFVLKYLENMGLGQISYIMQIGYTQLCLLLLMARLRLKLLLIIKGYHAVPLKRFIDIFGEITAV